MVTRSTKATTAFFGAESFHEGRGSAALAITVMKASAPTSAAARILCLRLVFIVVCFFKNWAAPGLNPRPGAGVASQAASGLIQLSVSLS